FSKAFDKLLHSRILSTCFDFQIPAYIVSWIFSFLSNRKQRVLCSGRFSDWAEVTSGVPQGSVLGPILFCLAIDSLKPVCPNSSIVKYADDVTILHFVRSVSADSLQIELDNILKWSDEMSLPVNPSKCSVLNIVTKKAMSVPDVFFPDGCLLKSVSSTVFLGVVFSNDLKWNLHVDTVIKKACKRIYIIRNLRRSGVSKELMIMSYVVFIRSVLLYGFPCFCNAPDYVLDKLSRIENRICRIINCDAMSPQLSDAAEMMCKRMVTSIEKNPDHLLRDMFEVRCHDRTRERRSLRPPRTRTSRFRKHKN
ncbi:MAG: reverse transcriptase domain-containing protein, partial [Pseudomonadota bacterium]